MDLKLETRNSKLATVDALGKLRRRLLAVVTSSLNTLFLPLLTILISRLAVARGSFALWGAFVQLMLLVQLGAHVVGWGNKEHLLRAFSRAPASAGALWRASLLVRLVLLPPLWLLIALLWGDRTLFGLLAVVLWSFGLVVQQSYEVCVAYKKDFSWSILVELLGVGTTILALVLAGPRLSVGWLAASFALATLFKALLLGLRYRGFVGLPLASRPRSLAWGYFGQALPFFLLGLSGMLQSRVDLYAVSYFLPSVEVGRYQVLIQLLIYLQALANTMLVPFVRAMYRLRDPALLKLTARLTLLGALLVPPGLALLALVLRLLYGLRVGLGLLGIGGLLVLPAYAYLPIIYALYKHNRQTVVLRINLLGIVCSLGLSLLLIPRQGLTGALLAAAGAQWAMLLAYGLQLRGLGLRGPGGAEDHAEAPDPAGAPEASGADAGAL